MLVNTSNLDLGATQSGTAAYFMIHVGYYTLTNQAARVESLVGRCHMRVMAMHFFLSLFLSLFLSIDIIITRVCNALL